MLSKAMTISGWVLSVLIATLLLGLSAPAKLMDVEGKEEQFAHLGWTAETMFGVGIAEVAVTLLFLFPPTSFVGAVLLTGYLGGATASHVRIDEPFTMPVVIGVLVWVALGLRDRRVFTLAFGVKQLANSKPRQTAEA